jgi:hypothetical protein
MGLISSLVDQEFKGKREEKQLQIEALFHVMQSSMNPEKKSEYAKEALKKIGLKGQNHEMFHNLLTKTAQADAKGQAKGKDYGSSSAEGGAGGLPAADIRNARVGELPPSDIRNAHPGEPLEQENLRSQGKHKGKQKGGDNWYDSD